MTTDDDIEREILSLHVTVSEAEWTRFIEELTAEFWTAIWTTWAEDAQKLRDLDRATPTEHNRAQSEKNLDIHYPRRVPYPRREPKNNDAE